MYIKHKNEINHLVQVKQTGLRNRLLLYAMLVVSFHTLNIITTWTQQRQFP